jgi:hypothetical protein
MNIVYSILKLAEEHYISLIVDFYCSHRHDI